MSTASGLTPGYTPTLYISVPAAQDLTAVSGAPKRNAAVLIFENNNAAVQTAAFRNGSATGTVGTATIPLASVYPALYGNFAALGALGATVTCLAGWIDDGTVQLNP